MELQNKPMMVRGWIRRVGAAVSPLDEPAGCIRAVKASVLPTVEHGAIGWQLDQFGLRICRHYSDHFQDPSLMNPNITGARFRTTLVKDKGEWFVLELCEPLASLVDMTANHLMSLRVKECFDFHQVMARRMPRLLVLHGQMRTFYNLVKALIQVAWMRLKLLLQRMLKFKV